MNCRTEFVVTEEVLKVVQITSTSCKWTGRAAPLHGIILN